MLVNYTEDTYYANKSNTTSFTVSKADSSIDITVNENYSVDDNITIKLKIFTMLINLILLHLL